MWFNSIITWLLRSPFHSFASKSMMLISFTGRKSGNQYSIPVNYHLVSDEQGEYLITTSFRQRTWWRNLRGGGPVIVRLKGRDLPATSEVIDDDQGVANLLLSYLKREPRLARYMGVHMDTDGQPNIEEVAQAAKPRVMVKTRLV